MKITLEQAENGWTITVVHSPEIPTRTVHIARDAQELLHILELTLLQDKGPTP